MAKKKAKKKSSGGLNTNYLTKMGAHNLVANRSMSFSSISVLTACLLLIGVSLTILLNIQSLVKDVESQNVVIAFVKDGVSGEELTKVGTDLTALPNVVNVEFVSKEVGYKEMHEKYEIEQGFFDGIIENPLPDSYHVKVSNLEDFNITLEHIKGVENVETVQESQELVNQISTLQKSITTICFLIVIVLVFVSIFIISNTIKITMVSRKIDIQVMKSVGATNLFICWPFMIEGVILGIISGLLALILTIGVDRIEGEAMTALFEMLGSSSISVMEYLPLLAVSYIVSGILISAVGSVVSIRKYLKKEGSEANED